MKLKRLMAAMTFVAAGVATAHAVAAVDPAIPSYTKTTGVSGNLSSVGSDTLANLMTLWAAGLGGTFGYLGQRLRQRRSRIRRPHLRDCSMG
ncbi:hypothetical protein ACQKP2_11500, partial [Pseudomonas sp. NPDC089569]